MAIAQSFIQELLARADVVEVVGRYVQLKKSGANFMGLCPFHAEKTPSFSVSPAKQFYHCFSCGKHGDAINFLMEHTGASFTEAVHELAQQCGLSVPEDTRSPQEKARDAQQSQRRATLSQVLARASQAYRQRLKDAPRAIGYLKKRGLTGQIASRFALGYAPEGWRTLAGVFPDYADPLLVESGLVIAGEGEGGPERRYDRFRDRIMFPIRSVKGEVIGFGARVLGNEKPKYLNSPESDIYHKSKVLYGIFFAKQAIAKADNCYLVEGYTDVIQLHQKGIENVVASSGTALTPDQIRLIHRLTPNITVLYDGDAAGLRASIRGIDLILEQGMNVKVCTFPDGEDPDSFARKTAYEDLVIYLQDHATDFIRFKASLLMQEAQDDPIKKAETIRDMINSIAKIPDAIKREVYVRECAVIMDISEEVLFSTLSQMLKKDLYEGQKVERKQPTMQVSRTPEAVEQRGINKLETLEHDLIKTLLLYANRECEFIDTILEQDEEGNLKEKQVQQTLKVYEKVFLELQEDEIELANPDFKQIYQLLMQKLNEDPEYNIDRIANELPIDLSEKVSDLIMEDENRHLDDWERRDIIAKDKDAHINAMVSDIILNIRTLLVRHLIQEIQAQFASAEEEEKRELLETVKSYLQLQKLLAKRLNVVVNY